VASFLSKIVSPTDLRTFLRATPSYNVNRDRAGAVISDGFAAYDTYEKFRPYLFIASLIGMAGSAYALKKRHRIGTEAYVTYITTFLASATTAYITRPGTSPALPPGATADEKSEAGFVHFIDTRVAKHRAEDPQFADKAFARFVAMPGVREQWAVTDPLIQATVL